MNTKHYTIYIPDNNEINESGDYSFQELVELLRKYKHNPNAIQFLADMMEE